MNRADDSSFNHDERLQQALIEYLDSIDAGKTINRDAFLARYSDIAEELSVFLASREELDRIASPIRKAMVKPGVAETMDQPTIQPDSHHPEDTETKPGTFGDYELLEEIARGGMGVVYKAKQTSLNRVVAVKMILSGQFASSEDVGRFRAEAEAAANLQHPNIVTIHEVGERDGQHFFSMDYIDGTSLTELVRERPLTSKQSAAYVQTMAEAIEYAHTRGILHRDLKPSNVLLDRGDQVAAGPTSQDSSRTEVKITDFGLAKRIEGGSELTGTGQALGTPSYMPPEQASGKRDQIGPPSDVYSLGAILYELLTGRPPFRAETPLDTLMQVLQDDPVSPRLLNSRVPKDLETICLKCLRKEPSQRYRTARALAADLKRFQNDQPIEARPISSAERLWYWSRRQQRSVKLTMVAVVLTVCALIALSMGHDLYERAQYGEVVFNTKGPQLAADIWDDRGNSIAQDISIPSSQQLPAGAYQMRLTRQGAFSKTYLFDVLRGTTQELVVSLPQTSLWPQSIELRSPDHFQLAEIDDRTDAILLPLNQHTPTLRRIDGRTGREVWSVDWRAASDSLTAVIRTQQDTEAWNQVLQCWNPARPNPPTLLRGDRDINQDGTGDLVWSIHHPPSLLAVSGNNGAALWWFRPDSSSEPPSRIIGTIATHGRDTDEAGFLIAAFHSPSQNWIESIAAGSGRSSWRYVIPDVAPNPPDSNMGGPSLCSVDDKTAVIQVVGSRVVGIDADNGQEMWPSYDLGFAPVRPAKTADLDGDGGAELLLVGEHQATKGYQIVCITPKTRQHAWPPVPVRIDRKALDAPDWPLIADLNGDDKQEIVLPVGGRQARPRTTADSLGASLGMVDRTRPIDWKGVEVLDGETGGRKLRWEHRYFSLSPRDYFYRELSMPQAEFLRHSIGPDLNGDGFLDLFFCCIAADLHHASHALQVYALSGKEGRKLWWSQVKLNERDPKQILPLMWGQPGTDGWPQLIATIRTGYDYDNAHSGVDSTFVFSASDGAVVGSASNLGVVAQGDFNLDRIVDLCTFSPSSGRFTDHPGQLQVSLGVPPESWRRFDRRLETLADLDSDGIVDLAESWNLSKSMRVFSGRTGKLLKKLNINWQSDGFFLPKGHASRAPHGDVNGDGVPDVILAARWGAMNEWNSYGRSPAIPLPLMAFSGRTGGELWTAPRLSQQEFIRWKLPRISFDAKIDPWYVQCHDLDGDRHSEVLCGLRFRPDDPQKSEHCWLALLNGQGSQLIWMRRLIEIGTEDNYRYLKKLNPTIADVNGDGVQDVIISGIPVAAQGPELSRALSVFSGSDGELLWQHALESWSNANQYARLLSRPVPSDLDGDGTLELVQFDCSLSVDPSDIQLGTIRGPVKLLALDGPSGKLKWDWESEPAEIKILVDRLPTPIVWDVANHGPRLVCLSVTDTNGRPRTWFLDSQGKPAQLPDDTPFRWSKTRQVHSADVNSDEKKDLVFTHFDKGHTLWAVSGADLKAMWNWSPQTSWNPLIVDVGTAEGDHPPVIRVVDGTTQLGINGETGSPLWRVDNRTSNSRFLGSLTGSRDTQVPGNLFNDPLTLPRVLDSRQGGATVCRLSLPADQAGRFLPTRPTSELNAEPPPYTWEIRPLPWKPSPNEPLEVITSQLLLAVAGAIVLLVIPGWLILGAIRLRSWTVTTLLVVPVVSAFLFTYSQYAMSNPTGVRGYPNDLPSRFAMMWLFSLMGLPMVAFPALLIYWTAVANWRRLALLIGLTVPATLASTGYMLLEDSFRKGPFERYSWEGWYLIWFVGAFFSTSFFLGVWLSWPPLRRIWQWASLRFKQRSVATSSSAYPPPT